MLGICKLCLNTSELQRSHIIGKSVFNNLFKNTEGNFGYTTHTTEKKIKKTNEHWTSYLLCAHCESLLNSRYENYALWSLKNKQMGVKHKNKEHHLQIQNITQSRLILYVISIFWRAIHSDHQVFQKLNNNFKNEQAIENHLRLCILNNVIPPKNLIYVKIFKLTNTTNILRDINLKDFISNIVQTKETNVLSFYTIFEGYYFEVIFSPNLNYKLSDLGVLNSRKKTLNIPYKELFSIKDFIDYWQRTRAIYFESQNNN